MDYKRVAQEILEYIGGEKNITYLEHCSTRLRFTLEDNSKADVEALKTLKGVMSVVVTAQFQVIIGNDVIEVYDELIKLVNLNQTEGLIGASLEKKKVSAIVLDFLIGVFNPLVAAITGGGLLKTVLTLMVAVGWLDKSNGIYQILANTADAAFYFLPVMVAFTAAAKLNCNRIVAVVLVGVSILPNMTTAMAEGISFWGLTVPNYVYSSQIFPAIMTVLFLKVLEKYVTKYCPKPVRMVFVPVICFLVTAPVSLMVLSPLGFRMGEVFTNGLLALHESIGWVVVAILGAILPFLTAAGMHKPLVPYAVAAFGSTGFDMINAPAKVAHNISEAGACFAVAVRSKNTDTRSTAFSAGISAFFGITEPALYGVTLLDKKVLASVVLSGFISAAVMGIAGLRSLSLMGTGILGLPQFVDPENGRNLIWAVVGYVLAISLSFGFTCIFYREDYKKKGEKADKEQERDMKNSPSVQIAVDCPVTGKSISLSEVNDQVFSSGVLGDGVAVIPESGEIYAPVDGIVSTIFETKHAISIIADCGAEILIHIGLDTIKMEGEGFIAYVKDGDRVKRGDLLIRVDLDVLGKYQLDPTTIVVVANTDNFIVTPENYGRITLGSKLYTLEVK